MKIAITGHTKGIGKEIFEYFQSQGHTCIGFARSNGYDIGLKEDRERILTETLDCDIFVNNACVLTDNSQFILLRAKHAQWLKTNKIIINVSSKAGDFAKSSHFEWPLYASFKERQDAFCELTYGNPWVINLKPGTVDTEMTQKQTKPKMNVTSVTKVLDFILSCKDDFRVQSITFIPL